MDTQMTPAVDVDRKLDEIKRNMPGVYASIQAKATQFGREVFVLVRRGLRGEPDCFYAIEDARVVGTPFNANHPDMTILALSMVEFGMAHATIWPEQLAPPWLKSKTEAQRHGTT